MPKIGFRHSEASISKMRIARIGRLASEETKLKMSLARKGKKKRPMSYIGMRNISISKRKAFNNHYAIDDNTTAICLTENNIALIDSEDLHIVNKYYWTYWIWKVKNTGYALATPLYETGIKTRIKMHRLIMGVSGSQTIDHVNRNGLDNRRLNLRTCNTTENNRNQGLRKDSTSGYKGVRFIKHNGRFWARIQVNKKRISLGVFKCSKAAAYAYDLAAIKYFKDFAYTNFPREVYNEK